MRADSSIALSPLARASMGFRRAAFHEGCFYSARLQTTVLSMTITKEN